MLEAGGLKGSVKTIFGNHGDTGLTPEEERTHFGIWCILSSPLLIGCDVRSMPASTMQLITNPYLLGMNQNDLGLQASVAEREGEACILVKDAGVKFGTSRYVALYNGSDKEHEFTVRSAVLDLDGRVDAFDLVEMADVGCFTQTVSVKVLPHGAKFYRFDAERRLQRKVYEAESAFLTDYHELYDPVKAGIAFPAPCALASGGMIVTNLGGRASNDLIWPEVKIDRSGQYLLSFFCLSPENGSFDVEVDGRKAGTVAVGAAKGRLVEAKLTLALTAGVHRLRLSNATSRLPAIDRLEINPPAAGKGGVAANEFRIRDPFVLADGGRYYLYESKPWSGGKGVDVRISDDLETWTEKAPVMTLPADVKVTAVWAPEVHKFNGKYYLFATITEEKGVRPVKAMGDGVDGKNLVPRGTWVFVADRPTGPFVPVKKGPVPPADFQTLDGTLYVEDGQPYMVYCHEWCQMGNGTIEYAPLTPDFSAFAASPKTLLDARSAMPGAGHVTDGPFFVRSGKSGKLYLIWSNMIKGKGYCVLVRSSSSGKIAGPWSKDEILYGENGGHAMLFRDKADRLRLSLHQPNRSPDERMKIFSVLDDGESLKLSDR
jgi:GH43 family beta-xylosidase